MTTDDKIKTIERSLRCDNLHNDERMVLQAEVNKLYDSLVPKAPTPPPARLT